MIEKYGKTNADKLADENSTARQIVKEINHFGISERQRYLVMYYLSLELEDVEKMKIISSFLRENCSDLTITGVYGGDE
jgi:hypothetical protein